MGKRSLVAVVCGLLLIAAGGCSKDEAQKIQPEIRGKRGENCQARNDCEAGLACLSYVCSKNEFDVDVALKQCDLVECTDTSDCCGDKPTSAPAKCADRDVTCSPSLPGCTAKRCTDDDACSGGTCLPGRCSIGAGECTTAADCQDVCSASGVCTRSGSVCDVDSDCTYYPYNTTGTCITTNRVCECTNPDYVAGAAICSDPDCTDICLLRCTDERCVADRSCEQNADCTPFGLTICSGSRCVECAQESDCEADETCDNGVCHKPCEHNEECPLFNECDADSGECVYVGCKSDRECILAGAGASAESPAANPGGEDPRLAKCLPSETEENVKICKIPCENDGSCGSQSVCEGGFCKFIGCQSDEECRAYLGLQNQTPTGPRPFVATAVCRE